MKKELLQQLAADFPHATKLNEPMQNYTSMRVGGPAAALVTPNTVDELKDVLKFCSDWHLPLFVMGNGSNLLVRDGGIKAVVLRISGALSSVRLTQEGMEAEAGISLAALAHGAADAGLGGLEFAAGIPGSLGGGVVMNAGAYGGEMQDVVAWALALDYEGNEHYYNNEELEFGYRRCALAGHKLIVARVGLKLREQDAAVGQALIAEYNKRRQDKQPLDLPSCGSVFKRPPGYFAGKLIEDAGLKGKRIGGAQVSPLHAGFIVNVGQATAADVENLIIHVRQVVASKFGVHLETEVRLVGEPLE